MKRGHQTSFFALCQFLFEKSSQFVGAQASSIDNLAINKEEKNEENKEKKKGYNGEEERRKKKEERRKKKEERRKKKEERRKKKEERRKKKEERRKKKEERRKKKGHLFVLEREVVLQHNFLTIVLLEDNFHRA